MLGPARDLPYNDHFSSAESYVDSLLGFVTSSSLLQILCGGVHILDFLIREPDLYETTLPAEWRTWFSHTDIADVLAFLLHENHQTGAREGGDASVHQHAPPPASLVDYVRTVQRLMLVRELDAGPDGQAPPQLTWRMAVGMNTKKRHEVQYFAAYIDQLVSEVSSHMSSPISHLLDFGSGQNYLGRVLAGEQYSRRVIAVESKQLNIDHARALDVCARLAERQLVWRNKKRWKATGEDDGEEIRQARLEKISSESSKGDGAKESADEAMNIDQANRASEPKLINLGGSEAAQPSAPNRITYVSHIIQNGDLDSVIGQVVMNDSNESTHSEPSNNGCNGIEPGEIPHDLTESSISSCDPPTFRGVAAPSAHSNSSQHPAPSLPSARPSIMTISLHSCGNLIHHGLRSLVLSPEVHAVALVGCCYNLCTERLGPPTYKIPGIRSPNDRVQRESAAFDPHGFPMSQRFMKAQHTRGQGIRFNITARMMAVQAPHNWTQDDYRSFFTRHFYRALLQRLFLDRGFIGPLPTTAVEDKLDDDPAASGQPVIIGSLKKAAYTSFVTYARAALAKLARQPERAASLETAMEGLTDAELEQYERRYQHRRHDLAVLWSLMAFSASLVECAIVVDRWLFLREQPEVDRAWVQTVFKYAQSPRNLVVVGIKKRTAHGSMRS